MQCLWTIPHVQRCATHTPFGATNGWKACNSHVEVVQVYELFSSLFGLFVRRRDEVDLPLSYCSGSDPANWTCQVLVLRRVASHLLDFPVFVMFPMSIGVWTRSASGRVVVISGLVLQEHVFHPLGTLFLTHHHVEVGSVLDVAGVVHDLVAGHGVVLPPLGCVGSKAMEMATLYVKQLHVTITNQLIGENAASASGSSDFHSVNGSDAQG